MIGAELAQLVARPVEDKDVDAARALEARDDAVDTLHRAAFTALLSKHNPYTIETAIDVTLLSRYPSHAAVNSAPVEPEQCPGRKMSHSRRGPPQVL